MRKQPKFQVGDMVEEFYFDGDMNAHMAIVYMVVKREFIYFKHPSRNRWCKNFRYTLKELDSDDMWKLGDNFMRQRNEFRKVA